MCKSRLAPGEPDARGGADEEHGCSSSADLQGASGVEPLTHGGGYFRGPSLLSSAWRGVANSSGSYSNLDSELLKAEQDDGPGTYRVISAGPRLKALPVSKDYDRTSAKVGEVVVQQEVKVLQVAPELNDGRRRARIADPAGWITLLATKKNVRFAVKQPDKAEVGAPGEPGRSWLSRRSSWGSSHSLMEEGAMAKGWMRGAVVGIFMVCALAFCVLVQLLWWLGVIQVVLGNFMTYVIGAVAAVLLALPLLFCFMERLLHLPSRIAHYFKRKLWELPTKIIPFVEHVLAGQLHKMEERIITKLTEMPHEVARAVTGGLRKGARTLKKASSAPATAFRKGRSKFRKSPKSSASPKTPKA